MKTQKGIREHDADELRKAKRLEPIRKSGKERHALYSSFDEEDEEGENDRSVEGKHPDLSFITINERARFRNNLFNGNKQQFDEAMELLQSLTGFEEARRYLIDDLEWNPAENEIQAEFLDKLYLCFQQAR